MVNCATIGGGNVICVRDAVEPVPLFKERARAAAQELGATIIAFADNIESVEHVEAAEDEAGDAEVATVSIGKSSMDYFDGLTAAWPNKGASIDE